MSNYFMHFEHPAAVAAHHNNALPPQQFFAPAAAGVAELTPVTQHRMHLEAMRRAAPPAAVADDTPSRHPCKVRVPSAQKRFAYDPYRGRVTLHLESGASPNATATADGSIVGGGRGGGFAPFVPNAAAAPFVVGGNSSSSGNTTDDDDAGVNMDAFASFAPPVAAADAEMLAAHHAAAMFEQQQQFFQTAPATTFSPQHFYHPQASRTNGGTTAYMNQNNHDNNDSEYFQHQQQQQHGGAQAMRRNFAPTAVATSGVAAAPWPLDDDHNDDDDDAATTTTTMAAMPGTSAHFTAEQNCFRMAPGTIRLALVRFKFAEELFYVPPAERGGLAVGDLVVVDGDRGENVGAVVGDASAQLPDAPERLCFQWHQQRQAAFRQQQQQQWQAAGSRNNGGGGGDAMMMQPDGPTLPPAPIDGVAGRVLRRALNKDRKRYFQARRKEAVANRAAQDSVRDLGLRMAIVDVEFQSDLQKLTIYYRPTSTDGLVDFRQLQRALFRQFRCRIWLVHWDRDMRPRQQQQLAAAVAAAAANAANVLGGAPSACVSPPPQVLACAQ